MVREDKIIRKMKESPRNLRFSELDGFLSRRGFECRQPRKGSSHYFYFREGRDQVHDGQASRG